MLFSVLFSRVTSFLCYCTVAYNKALEDAIAVLDKIAVTVDVKDRKFYLSIFIIESLEIFHI